MSRGIKRVAVRRNKGYRRSGRAGRRRRADLILGLFLVMLAFVISRQVNESLSSKPVELENRVESGAVQDALADLPAYRDMPSAEVGGNTPFFTSSDLTTESFELYSDLDSLGRCGTAYANLSEELMPTEERGAIGSVRPSGWHTVKYKVIEEKYLYNRCHLIAFSLAGENANEKNLITGTRYFNTEGMEPYESAVRNYIRRTGNHVLYRVTPVYKGKNLVASGVLMEAYSVEDRGEGICFCVYCYNVQPGVEIDYRTGRSRLAGS